MRKFFRFLLILAVFVLLGVRLYSLGFTFHEFFYSGVFFSFSFFSWDYIVAPDSFSPSPEAANPEAANPEGAKPEGAKPEGAKPEAANPEGAKPEGAKPEAAKPEPNYDLWYLGLGFCCVLLSVLLMLYFYYSRSDSPEEVQRILLGIEELLQSYEIHGGGFNEFLQAHSTDPAVQHWPQIEAMRLHTPGASPVSVENLKVFHEFLWQHAPGEFFEELAFENSMAVDLDLGSSSDDLDLDS